eukprot:COSAG01_NODE_707_length_14133_cov_34.324093_5_plen_303_part_00
MAPAGVVASQLLAAATTELARTPQALRAFYAIVGAFVADASATPTHWVYDTEQLESGLAGRPAAFFQPSLNPFYTRPLGAATCYGEQLLITLRSLVEHGGEVDNAHIGRTIAAEMGVDTEYGALDTTIFGTRELPISGPWRHGSVMHYLQELQAGKGYLDAGGPDDQAEAYVKTLPLTVAFAGTKDCLETVEDSIRTLQDNDAAVVYGLAAARVLGTVVLGGASAAAIAALPAQLKRAKRANPQPDDRYVSNRLDQLLTLAADTSNADFRRAVERYSRGFDQKTYLRHDGVEVAAGPSTPLN